jgi:threonine/homoserine/homoserine lactone efflux protein
MFGTVNLSLFIAAGLLLNITPGADLLYIGSHSASQGRWAGTIAALGIGAGCLVHVTAATLGLSVLLATSAIAFTLVKLVGGIYLIYLGVITLRSAAAQTPSSAATSKGNSKPTGLQKIFLQAILVNTLNPKVALFFLALLPQFVAKDAAHPSLAFLFLGLIFVVNGTIINILFALFSATLAASLKKSAAIGRIMKTATGCLFIFLGLRLAAAHR